MIPARFNGPPASGNGGFSAGRLAQLLAGGKIDQAVEVTIRRPVPLDVDLSIDFDGDTATATEGAVLIAEARLTDRAQLGEAVAPVPFEVALLTADHYPGKTNHPFPTCFVCGPGRPLRDGLEPFPGPVDGDPTYTAAALVLRPEHESTAEYVWAALDCPGGWAMDLPNRPAVLGRVAGVVTELPAIGEHCVVVGTLDGWDGRKAFTRTTAYGADGRELGRTQATWIELS
jgi:hypothetical protein